MRIKKDNLLRALPPEWREDPLPEIQALVKKSGAKIVIIDDDPTGTQAIYDVPVLTEWSRDSLAAVLTEPGNIVCLLSNTRGLPPSEAQALNREIGLALRAAGKSAGRGYVVVQRSDSTLRGHYPGEVTALLEGLDQKFDGVILVPFFLEGGRLTANDVHYVTEGDWLVPAGETEFARDASFAYQNSNLRAWVSEKHQGHLKPEEVVSVPLSDLRIRGPEAVAARLSRVYDGQTCIVNAASYRDLEVFVAGLLRAEAAGKRFLYRTAASFIRVRGGLAPRSPLTSAELAPRTGGKGGLILAGSHVNRSTAQIEVARSLRNLASVEVAVEKLLASGERAGEIRRVVGVVDEALAAAKDTLVYTSRQLVMGADEIASLKIGQSIATALVKIIDHLTVRPGWMIVKGGNTASNIATKGLGVRRAQALGQALPGVPIWLLGEESRWPGLIYVVFPGNVGAPEALAKMTQILRG